MNLGASEIFLILVVVLLLFGGKRLPELARSLGKGLAEFRRAAQSVQREVSATVNDPPPTTKSLNPPPALNAHPDSQPRKTSPGTDRTP